MSAVRCRTQLVWGLAWFTQCPLPFDNELTLDFAIFQQLKKKLVPLRSMMLCEFESVPVCNKAYGMLALHSMLPIFSVKLYTNPPYMDQVGVGYRLKFWL
jgi:hypothetical protein